MAIFSTQYLLPVIENQIELWWVELINSLPTRMRRHVGSSRWRIASANTDWSNDKSDNFHPIAAFLPATEYLVRELELPIISRFQLPGLMKFEAMRHIPFPLNMARYDFKILHRDFARSRMTVELIITHKDSLTAVETAAGCVRNGVEGILITAPAGQWVSRRLIAKKWQHRWLNRRLQLLYIHFAIPVCLLLILIAGAQNWANRLLENREDSIHQARLAADTVLPLKQQLVSIEETFAAVSQARAIPSAAVIAEEVAMRLPDDAWLSELDIEPKQVRLSGTARNAGDLLKTFSASPLFTDVQFSSPLTSTPGASGVQFDLTLTRDQPFNGS